MFIGRLRKYTNSEKAQMIELKLSGMSYAEIKRKHGFGIVAVKNAMSLYRGVNSGNKMITLQSGI